MRFLHFEHKEEDTPVYVFNKVLNGFIPIVLSFWLGFSRNYWLIPVILAFLIFEYSFDRNRFIVRF